MGVNAGLETDTKYRSGIDLGCAALLPDGPVTAGDYITWTVTHTVGQYGIDDGGSLLLAVRQMCDWGEPQMDDPAGENFVTASTTADATLLVSWNRRAYERPWRQGIMVRVLDGHLAPGDELEIVLGDTAGGGPGLRLQTFVEREFAMRLFVDPSGSHQFNHVTDLEVPVVAGQAITLAMVGPSNANPDESSWLHVRAHDRWGNVADTYRGSVSFSGPDGVSLPGPYAFTESDRGFHRFENVQFSEPGIYRITVNDEESGFLATANPCVLSEDVDAPKLYWGDLHGQSGETVGSGDAAAYWDFLHYASGTEYGGHCGNDFQITPEFYQRLRSLAQKHHEPGRFVTFLSYEWSGNYPVGGDNNVYFLHDDEEQSPIYRSGQWLLEEEPDDGGERHPISAVQEEFAGRDDVLILPHIGGRRANLDMLADVEQSPVIEISSIHGRFPWFAREALERGLKVGFIAGSDDHCGRPGVAPPSTHDLVVPGGLSAIYASDLSRESLWHGLKSRQCYGSSGARIIVDVDWNGHPMGAECSSPGPVKLTGTIDGTAPIATVDVLRDTDVVWTLDHLSGPAPTWNGDAERAQLRLAWSGANSKNRPKVSTWDGGLSITGGRILKTAPYNLRHPDEGITSADDNTVSWKSHTSGEEDGVWLDLEVSPGVELRFETPLLTRTFALEDVGDKPLVVPVEGGVDLQLELRWTDPDPGPMDVEIAWEELEPVQGEHAYWIWVTQRDGEVAWSSPVYMEGTR